MTDEPGRFANPMAWWGEIQGRVTQHATTAEVWSAIRDFGQEHNLSYPPGMFQAVNEMRGLAAGLRNASDALGKAAPDAPLVADYIATLPYARQATARDLVAQYHVRVEYTALRGGQEERSYITLPYSGGLPDTVGALWADAQVATEALVQGYGADLASVDRVEIGSW